MPVVTRVLTVGFEPYAVAEAARIVRAGGLVAFPTETVYGLGADATDPDAVARLFAAKGRPPTNPIIVHAPDARAAESCAARWPEIAGRLAIRFWPGPLTLVVEHAAGIVDAVAAGGPTVGVRVPQHPIALEFLRLVDRPVAAPSANRSETVSPTTAAHVLKTLAGRINAVLDAGSCPGGVESTVVDCTSTPPRILRPGLLSVEMLRTVAPDIVVATQPTAEIAPSPGQHARHYAPVANLLVVEDAERVVGEAIREGKRVGWIRREASSGAKANTAKTVVLPNDPAGFAHGLYAALHELDDAGVEVIVVEKPPETEEWLAVNDRLRRAGTPVLRIPSLT